MAPRKPSPSTPRRRLSADGLARWLLGLEVALAIAAYGGAIGLLTGLIPLDGPMQDVPFESAVLAGIALGLVVAVPPTAVVVATVTHRAWAAPGHLVVGAALMGWIVMQIAFIGLVAWLQPIMFAWGATIFVLGGYIARQARSNGSYASQSSW